MDSDERERWLAASHVYQTLRKRVREMPAGERGAYREAVREAKAALEAARPAVAMREVAFDPAITVEQVDECYGRVQAAREALYRAQLGGYSRHTIVGLRRACLIVEAECDRLRLSWRAKQRAGGWRDIYGDSQYAPPVPTTTEEKS